MEAETWESSDDETQDQKVDLQEIDEDDHLYMSGSIPKYQFRKDVSKACWDAEMGLAEVIEKKGGMWTTTGIVRKSKVYCSIEETLFLVERGALLLYDMNDIVFPLQDIYMMVAEGKNGCSWDSFQAYTNLKSLGYIVGRHGVPWTVKNDKSGSTSMCTPATKENNGVLPTEVNEVLAVTNLIRDTFITDFKKIRDIHNSGEVKPAFDVYLPNSKFKKSSPGDPNFMVHMTRGNPPSREEIEDVERICNGFKVKFCHVEDGRVSFFAFDKVQLPILP